MREKERKTKTDTDTDTDTSKDTDTEKPPSHTNLLTQKQGQREKIMNMDSAIETELSKCFFQSFILKTMRLDQRDQIIICLNTP